MAKTSPGRRVTQHNPFIPPPVTIKFSDDPDVAAEESAQEAAEAAKVEQLAKLRADSVPELKRRHRSGENVALFAVNNGWRLSDLKEFLASLDDLDQVKARAEQFLATESQIRKDAEKATRWRDVTRRLRRRMGEIMLATKCKPTDHPELHEDIEEAGFKAVKAMRTYDAGLSDGRILAERPAMPQPAYLEAEKLQVDELLEKVRQLLAAVALDEPKTMPAESAFYREYPELKPLETVAELVRTGTERPQICRMMDFVRSHRDRILDRDVYEYDEFKIEIELMAPGLCTYDNLDWMPAGRKEVDEQRAKQSVKEAWQRKQRQAEAQQAEKDAQAAEAAERERLATLEWDAVQGIPALLRRGCSEQRICEIHQITAKQLKPLLAKAKREADEAAKIKREEEEAEARRVAEEARQREERLEKMYDETKP